MNQPKFKFYVSSHRNLSFNESIEKSIEDMGYSEEDWEELSLQEQEEILQDEYSTFLGNVIDGGWEEL